MAANAEAVIKREKLESEPRRFSFRTPASSLSKKKDSLAIACTRYGKKKKDSPEANRVAEKKRGTGVRQFRRYDFKGEGMEGIYEELLMSKKILSLVPKTPEEVGRVHDPKYCRYHQIVGYPTNICSTLRNVIQDLVDAGVLITFKEEEFSHSINAISLTSEKVDARVTR